jgi:murein tripeptide amidase MpaA
MRELEQQFPDITEFESMGVTAENRTIHGIRIVNEEILAQRNDTMPLLLITGGASAREWISVMAAVNIIHELVEHYDDFRILVDYLEWFVVPVM